MRVSQDFSCKYPNSPQINCELPTNNINPSFSTIFAQSDGSVEFPPNSAQTNISSPSATIDDSNYLPSSNIPIYTNPTNPTIDNANFLYDVNYPDKSTVTPGQALTKIWRFKNTGTTTWGSGYQLAYFSGNQLGAPNAVNLPSSVAPGQTVDIGVPVQIPSNATPGIYWGDWQLRNPSGTYFGDDVWYSLQVPSNQSGGGNAVGSSGYTTDCPTTVSPGQQWVCNVTVTVTSGQLLESRGDMLRFFNGTNYTGFDHVAVTGSVNSNQTYTFRFYNNNPFTAPQNGGTYTNRWKIWANNGWVDPEINLDFTVSVSHPPNPPLLTSPNNWATFVQQQVQLCAQANGGGDGYPINQYHFVIYDSGQNYDSGWVNSNCVTTSGLGNYGYKWHAQVRDSRNIVSGWSEDRNFNIYPSTPVINRFYFDPTSPSNSQTVKVWVEVQTCGNTAPNIQVRANTATDGSGNGKWVPVNGGGLNVTHFDETNVPKWDTRDFAEGQHLIRVDVTSCVDPNVHTIQDQVYTLTRGIPSHPYLLSPVSQFWTTSPTVTFNWQPALRANNYTLVIGTTIDPNQAPVLQITNLTATSYTATFSQDYPQLYWSVTANNENGNTSAGFVNGVSHPELETWFGIDRTTPVSTINNDQTPAVSYETQFPVSWNGTDSGSGIQNYHIQTKADTDGQWGDWLANFARQYRYLQRSAWSHILFSRAGYRYSG